MLEQALLSEDNREAAERLTALLLLGKWARPPTFLLPAHEEGQWRLRKTAGAGEL